jgi:hypothetical protein
MIRQGGSAGSSRHVIIDIPPSPASSKRKQPLSRTSRLDGEKLFAVLLVVVVLVWLSGYIMFLRSQQTSKPNGVPLHPSGRPKPTSEVPGTPTTNGEAPESDPEEEGEPEDQSDETKQRREAVKAVCLLF